MSELEQGVVFMDAAPALHHTAHISQKLPLCLHIYSKVNLQTVLKQGIVGVLRGLCIRDRPEKT